MEDLVQAYEEEKDARIKERILAVKLHLVDGKSEKEVSKMLNKGYSTIKLWVGKYKKEGLDGLRDKPRSGRPRKAEKEKQMGVFLCSHLIRELNAKLLEWRKNYF
ncbi:hypothetical protein YN1551_2108 [Sulfolobus islandicus Y.N.15.51]|uniref:Transposase n=1 Tax=Saccharolobus islandicus (strain Y.N.15.51 / Yellowstone \|nr:hypothetical protein YN1551_2108 [Sulfolobus islandicus Y.N.15.51]